MVKRLRRRPLTAKSAVRVRLEVPTKSPTENQLAFFVCPSNTRFARCCSATRGLEPLESSSPTASDKVYLFDLFLVIIKSPTENQLAFFVGTSNTRFARCCFATRELEPLESSSPTASDKVYLFNLFLVIIKKSN